MPGLQPLVGAAVILGIAVAFSTDRAAIRWSTIAWGLGLRARFAGTLANFMAAAIAGSLL